MVVGTQEDAEEGDEEDVEVIEEDHSPLELLWSRRDQTYSRIQMHPQCLVLILRDLDGETS